MWASEGGFAPSGIEVGGVDLEAFLLGLFGYTALPGDLVRFGRVRITVERLEFGPEDGDDG